MQYDIIFISGEKIFDHSLCGIAILKRLMEKRGYIVGVIEEPKKDTDVLKLGKPRLFFGIGTGCIDSMVRNYTPLNKKRAEVERLNFVQTIPDRAMLVYSNWVKRHFKDSILVIGGVEAALRRLTHYDYWDNKLRRSILLESRADILVYGCGEKQIEEITRRIREKKDLKGIEGTCIRSKDIPDGFTILPSHEEVLESKKKFCDMQIILSNNKNLAQKTDKSFVLQYKSPVYTSHDLDEYYELPFTRKAIDDKTRGFEFSIVTHRGCIGNCNFCSLRLTMGDKIISRSEESILKEIKHITTLSHFKGNIDDLGGPSANMYAMDCTKDIITTPKEVAIDKMTDLKNKSAICHNDCITCKNLDKSHTKLISLMKKARAIPGVKKIFVRSGVRYDLATKEYLKELINFHISGKLKIAPEHINKNILQLMNKDVGNLEDFIKTFNTLGRCDLAFYFITAHPGSTIKEAKELANIIKKLRNAESVQIFTPTPMTVSTCMYYTGMDPRTYKTIHVPNTYREKKEQKRILMPKN
ncbi:MAG: YgiQ family radical SAM protein [Candidatus Aenigmatarchaeota archaeon]